MCQVLFTDFYFYGLHLLSNSPKSKQSYYNDFKDISIHFQEIKGEEKCKHHERQMAGIPKRKEENPKENQNLNIPGTSLLG